ncbi:MAG: hypothetical protein R6W67_11250 [Bacteroidales bacterium]
MKKESIGILIIIGTITLVSCNDIKRNIQSESEAFKLYTSKDTFLVDQQVTRQIPTVDRIVRIEKNRSILEKLTIIADSLSDYYFNGLGLEVTIDQDNSNKDSTYVIVNLLEKDSYDGPGSLPSYQSWYDFFQGSAGGLNTQITLEESFLQKEFYGLWIAGVRFFYQGSPIEQWDHLNLSGLKTR